jgi:hypothetical protein
MGLGLGHQRKRTARNGCKLAVCSASYPLALLQPSTGPRKGMAEGIGSESVPQTTEGGLLRLENAAPTRHCGLDIFQCAFRSAPRRPCGGKTACVRACEAVEPPCRSFAEWSGNCGACVLAGRLELFEYP